MASKFDLSTVFKAVTKALKENQSSLNAADEYNGDHGTNMVKTFDLIQKAVKSKSGESVSDQLAFASQQLRAKSTSGSAKLYAEGLEDAAEQFKGKEFNQKSAGMLINALMGSNPTAEKGAGDFLSTLLGGMTGSSQSKPQPQAQQPAPEQPEDLVGSLLGSLGGAQSQQQAQQGGGDLLGSLLGGLGGAQAQQQPQQGGGDLLGSLLGGLGSAQTQQQPQQGGGDLLSTLLGSLGGGQSSSQGGSGGLDTKDLLSAALAYFSAKRRGQSNMQAIMQAISAASRFGGSKDRAQSGALVVNTILNMMGAN